MYGQLTKVLTDAFKDCVGSIVLQQYPITLKRPPDLRLGDIAIPCFVYAKHTGVSLDELGASLIDSISSSSLIDSASFNKGFLNLKLTPQILFKSACQAGLEPQVATSVPETIMVEYLSPNTNKPLHLGHVRNGVIGSSVANILEAVGHQVVRANLVNDRGIHICKSMLAWQRFADGMTPKSADMKGDHFVGDWYVRFSVEAKVNPELEAEAEDMLRRWEEGDPKVMKLWRTMNDWVLSGFATTYEKFGFKFDKTYFESELYQLGKGIVTKGLECGVFSLDKRGNVVFELDPNQFGHNADGSTKLATVLRDDGTSMYLTQDFGTAVRKVEDFNIDRSIYVVACEQDDHFMRLFTILKALGYKWASGCYHLSYQMVELPTGRMKSREGTVIDADDLLEEVAAMAVTAIRDKSDRESDDTTISARAADMAMAAIKFGMLQVDPRTKIKFDPSASIAFEGDTGPYCLYAYVRAQKLLARAKENGLRPATTTLGALDTIEERALALDILDLEEAVVNAGENYNPTIVLRQVLQIARSFSRFYTQCPIFDESVEKRQAAERLALVEATASAIKYALSLLGIETVHSM